MNVDGVGGKGLKPGSCLTGAPTQPGVDDYRRGGEKLKKQRVYEHRAPSALPYYGTF